MVLLSDELNPGSWANWGWSPLHLKCWIQLRSDWWNQSCLWSGSNAAAQRTWSVRCPCCCSPTLRSCVLWCLRSFCIRAQTVVRSHRTENSWKGQSTTFVNYLRLYVRYSVAGVLWSDLCQINSLLSPLSLCKFLHSLEPIGKALVSGEVVVIARQLEELDLSYHFKLLIGQTKIYIFTCCYCTVKLIKYDIIFTKMHSLLCFIIIARTHLPSLLKVDQAALKNKTKNDENP